MSIIDHPHWTAALEICQKLTQAGFRALLAGGCVRDHILGRIANDIDLVTNATPEDIEQLFERVVPVGKQFGVMRVVIDSVSLEVASFRSDGAYIDGRRPVNVQLSTPEADAHRRDFTVNAMFMDPKSLEILDFVGGQADLQQHLLKAVGEPEVRFQEDHLRVLRAVRFVAQLGFKLDAATGAAVVASAPLTASVSGERLQEELNKLFSGPALSETRHLLIKSDLFKHVLALSEPQNRDLVSVLKGPEGQELFQAKLELNTLDRWIWLSYLCPSLVGGLAARLKWSREDKMVYDRVLSMLSGITTLAESKNGEMLLLRDSLAGQSLIRLLKAFAGTDPLKRGMVLRFDMLKLRWPQTPERTVDGDDLMKTGISAGRALAVYLSEIYELQLENPRWSKTDLLAAFSSRQKT